MSSEEKGRPSRKSGDFEKDLAALINEYSLEGNSNTPDFLLAGYMMQCLRIWNITIAKRDQWYGQQMQHEANSTLSR